MSRLPVLNARRLIKIIEHIGFTSTHQKGSHMFFSHPDGRSTVVPFHKGEDLGRGLLRSILRDIEITPKELEVFLRRY